MRLWKNGRQSGRQRYQCASCKHIFVRRYRQKEPWVTEAYDAYAHRRQTYADLRDTYDRDPKTLRKWFDACAGAHGEIILEKKPVNLILDATFFKRTEGILVCRITGRNLYWKEITGERIEEYDQCLDTLIAAGFCFRSFTIDGRKGVRTLLQKRFPEIPIQQCQFHQIQTITQKLTRNPKLQAGKELRAIMQTLTRSTRKKFTAALDAWHEHWGEFLKERTFSVERKRRWRYMHERLRGAYFSLRRNLPWLFTYRDHPKLHIPNTTNSCEGSFGQWKGKVELHRGISKRRKKQMIDYLLER